MALTRREFLLQNQPEREPTALEHESNTQNNAVNVAIFENRIMKLNIVECKDLPPNIKKLLEILDQYQNSVLPDVEQNDDYQFNRSGKKTEHSFAERVELWQQMQDFSDIIPILQTKFSLGAYNTLFSKDIPAILAHYGIAAKAIPLVAGEFDTDKIEGSDILLVPFQTEPKGNSRISLWGTEVIQDVLHIRRLANINPRTYAGMESAGQTLNQNIWINPALIESSLADRKASLDQIIEATKPITSIPSDELPEIIYELAKKNNISTTQAANVLAFTGIIQKTVNYPDEVIRSLFEQKTIAHETGHVKDQGDPKFTETLKLNFTHSLVDFYAQNANLMIHEEINGILTEMRYAADIYAVFEDVMMLAQVGAKVDWIHYYAQKWILNRVIEKIKQNPALFSITINLEIPVPAEDQIVAQLPAILEHKDSLNAILEELYRYHQSNLQEDFSEQVLLEQGIKPAQLPGNSWNKLIGYLAPLAAAGIGLELLRRRKNRISEARARQQTRTKRKNKKK